MTKFKSNLNEVLAENEDHVYYLLTVMFGEKVYKAYLDWAGEAVELLKKMKQES